MTHDPQSILVWYGLGFPKAAIIMKLEIPQAVLQAVCDVIELISSHLL